MTQTTTEAIARIIEPHHWHLLDGEPFAKWNYQPGASMREALDLSLARAAEIQALPELQPGEEFLEFKEALSDLRSLRHEYECLNGGGPGWAGRNKAAWAKVDELFENEDEAAYDRQQEDAHG